MFSIVMAINPAGKTIGGVAMNPDSAILNSNFYKCTEGFLESLPQAVYQLAIVFRLEETSKMPIIKYIFRFFDM